MIMPTDIVCMGNRMPTQEEVDEGANAQRPFVQAFRDVPIKWRASAVISLVTSICLDTNDPEGTYTLLGDEILKTINMTLAQRAAPRS